MRKEIIAAMASAVVLAPISVLAAPPSSGAPCDPNSTNENMFNAACHACVDPAMAAHDNAAYNACFGITPPSRATTPAQAPSNPPTRAPNTTPAQAPSNPPPTQAPATTPVQAPSISPPTPPPAPPTQAAAVRPPKGLGASPQAVERNAFSLRDCQ